MTQTHHWHDLAQVPHDPQVSLLVLIPIRHDDLRPELGDFVHEVSAQETRTSENCNGVARDGRSASGRGSMLDDGRGSP
jgi:hypothetical protein